MMMIEGPTQPYFSVNRIAGTSSSSRPFSAADIAGAMKAVTSALAGGEITPGEAATIAAVVDTFVPAIETCEFERRLQLVEAGRSNHPGLHGAGPGGYFNPKASFCSRFAAGVAMSDCSSNF
jgi:hypothetical protein